MQVARLCLKIVFIFYTYVMTAIEIIALVLIVISVVKIAVFFVHPPSWYTAKTNPLLKLFGTKMSAMISGLVL